MVKILWSVYYCEQILQDLLSSKQLLVPVINILLCHDLALVTGSKKDLFSQCLIGEKDLLAIIDDLDKKYQLVSAELGKEKEGSIKDLRGRFAHQNMEGSLFGIKGRLILPKFWKIEKYISDDSKTEIDILAENTIKWAVEIKWKTKAAGAKEIESFFRKASPFAKRCWYISKAGFTEQAKDLASQKGILFSAEKEVQILGSKVEKS